MLGSVLSAGLHMSGWIVLRVVVLVILSATGTCDRLARRCAPRIRHASGIRNRLVRLRALVKEAFSGITVQLRRRADLIPNLVESVQGYGAHEREVFEEVSKARAASVNAGSVAATAQAD